MGGMLRFALGQWIRSGTSVHWLLPTLGINVLAALLLGVVMASLKGPEQVAYQWLLAAGFCGGLSTFSTFSWELLILIQNQQWVSGLIYATASVGGTVLACWAGYEWMGG